MLAWSQAQAGVCTLRICCLRAPTVGGKLITLCQILAEKVTSQFRNVSYLDSGQAVNSTHKPCQACQKHVRISGLTSASESILKALMITSSASRNVSIHAALPIHLSMQTFQCCQSQRKHGQQDRPSPFLVLEHPRMVRSPEHLITLKF